MPYEAIKHGQYTRVEAVIGIKGYDIPGGSGICTICTVVWNYTAQHPEHANYDVSILGYPGNVADDGLGEAGALRTFFQDGDDPNLWFPGPIDVTEIEGGWLGSTFRMDISVTGEETDNGIAEITLTCTMLDSTVPEDFPGITNIPETPKSPDDVSGGPPEVEQDPLDNKIVVITFKSGGDIEDEDGYVIERSKVGGEFPWDIAGTVSPDPDLHPNYEFTDNLEDNGFDIGEGLYTYRVRTFNLDPDPDGPTLSDPTEASEGVTYGGLTTLTITGNITFDMDWQSVMTFLVDPSGIYTLIEGQRYDRLYNRAGETYVDVKIPNQFIKLGPVK